MRVYIERKLVIFSIAHAYKSIFKTHLQFVFILYAHNFSMVTQEINSLLGDFQLLLHGLFGKECILHRSAV